MTVKSKEGYYVRGTVSELMAGSDTGGNRTEDAPTSNGEF